ncbi:MAG: hypothetical protein ACK4UJ_04810 [Leptonema sp. (in: bacteria)]
MIVPIYIDIVLFSLLMLVLLILSYGFYKFIYIPSKKLYLDLQSPPLEVGSVTEIVVDQNQKKKVIRIGSLLSDISLRLKGIEDPHVEIQFVKEKGLEEYEIILYPVAKKKTLWKAPHTQNFILLETSEKLESREFIGHPGYLRLVGLMQSGRPLHYVEVEISVKYFIDSFGEERMKFLFKINRIYPGIDLDSRDKRGIYSFGRSKEAIQEES